MRDVTVSFERVGRNHQVPDATFTVADEFDLAEQIYRHVRPMLGSRDVEVYAQFDGPGGISCGFQSGGSFTATTDQKDS